MPVRYLMLSMLALVMSGCTPDPGEETASMILTDARIWTADPSNAWANALAVRGDRIAAVGSAEEVLRLAGPGTITIDGRGRLVTPGFIDSHVHFLEGGYRLASVQLRDARSPEEFARRIEEFAASIEPGTWIVGGDWDHQNWGGVLPQSDWIDDLTPENPVWVVRLDGHMGLANRAAMRIAGVTAATQDVDGGEIVRDTDGRPTGIFKDNAMSLIYRVEPDPTDAMKDRALREAMRYVASHGVTSVHTMGGTVGELATIERAHEAGDLITRFYAAVPLSTWESLRDRMQTWRQTDEWLRLGGLKGFVDGSLGSHTAAMLEPYSDTPSDLGLLVEREEDLYQWISGADRAGLQVMTHAIGDRAIRILLDIFERVAEENGPRDRRFRIEHAQHIHPDDLDRFADLSVIPSMQPYHAIDDGRWAEEVIGPARSRTTYAFRSLLDAGARPAFGSDWFVAPPIPVEGIYAAVTRSTLDGEHPDGWIPEEKITAEEALRAYTADAAYASFDEDVKGKIATGMLADFVVFDRDLTTIPAESIPETQVDLTVVGGKVVFDRSAEENASGG